MIKMVLERKEVRDLNPELFSTENEVSIEDRKDYQVLSDGMLVKDDIRSVKLPSKRQPFKVLTY
jgi:hypothetical protein